MSVSTCGHSWGNCTGKFTLAAFGKPGRTPHRCDGAERHVSKLHRCGICGSIGAITIPIKGTKAGNEYAKVVAIMQQNEGETIADSSAA